VAHFFCQPIITKTERKVCYDLLTHREILQAVDTLKALKIVGINGGQSAYVYFP
jgi:hypothetical protein